MGGRQVFAKPPSERLKKYGKSSCSVILVRLPDRGYPDSSSRLVSETSAFQITTAVLKVVSHLIQLDQDLSSRNSEEQMDNPHTVSKLRTTSNSLNFNPCSYTFRMHPIVFVDACSNEYDHECFSVNNCRPQRLKADVNVIDLSAQESAKVNLSDQVRKFISVEGLHTTTLPKMLNPHSIKNSLGMLVKYLNNL